MTTVSILRQSRTLYDLSASRPRRRAGADGLGAFRQLGWTASLWLCTHAVLVADAVCRVHPAAGCGDAVALHGACVRVLRRGDADGVDRQHEDGGRGPGRRAAALSSEDAGLRH